MGIRKIKLKPSGSTYKVRNPKFYANPQTYITTVGLYDNPAGGIPELMAVGRLSAPVKKNKSTEVTLKVNLTF